MKYDLVKRPMRTQGLLQENRRVYVNSESTTVEYHKCISYHPYRFELKLSDGQIFEHGQGKRPKEVLIEEYEYIPECLSDELFLAYRSHDWYHMMSDDGSVFRRGQKQFNEIKRLESEAKPSEIKAAILMAEKWVPNEYKERKFNA